MRNFVSALWKQRRSPAERIAWAALTPLSLLYSAALKFREHWWRWMAQRAPVAIISVGNLSVGGSGKTPFTLFLGNLLLARGYRTAIVSRGYGRKAQHALLVSEHGKIAASLPECGDEPLMLARFFAGPIAVARRRIEAIRLLLARGPLDVILLDDGFQHLRLRRDLDLVLLRYPESSSDQWVLPAGPLRESRDALHRADAIVLIGDGFRQAALKDAAPHAFRVELKPNGVTRSRAGKWQIVPLDLAGRRVVAVCGIARPEHFAAMLRALGARISDWIEYPDHHPYTARDWSAIRAAAARAELVITTEKDLVKLECLSPALESLYALHLEVAMDEREERALARLVCDKIETNRAARESQA